MIYKEYVPKKIDSRTLPKNNSGMFKTKCSFCGNPMFTYATDKLGTLHSVYCTTACETNSKYPSRFKK